MSRPRTALATVLPPACSICLATELVEPAWCGSDEVVCGRCCSGTRSLLRRGNGATIADVWFLDSAVVQSFLDRDCAEPVDAHTRADLAIAYSEMSLDRDALMEAILAVRRGDERVWECMTRILLGDHIQNPVFRAGLRAALPATAVD